jgi:signal transduction histidine kinase/ActR/RegA family two-component response regulator
MRQIDYVPREKRLYNKWVATQTLEDYALRYTAEAARRWPARTVSGTAIGATAFLACEAIGASITLAYGFANSLAAIAVAMVVMFVVGLPIAYEAAKRGLDIDLLTRGAAFGYLGSTLTSLIYASFTFLLFSVEATIMAVALEAMTGMSMSVAYLVSALAVIPIALYGMSLITRFQAWTQGVWIVLQVAPIAYILWLGPEALAGWSQFTGELGASDGTVSLISFGLALSTLLSLLPQIGEQADYLRFLPSQERIGPRRWWVAMVAGGPGWTVIAGIKLLLGSYLAWFVVSGADPPADPASPTALFRAIFTQMTDWPALSLVLTGLFVIVCQLKINVTNAYAGSIAWSNFFSRLTHSHPGRIVWLVFNVLIALILMETGIFAVIEQVLIVYATVAAGWIGALAADLMISKPLGLSPRGIEFKRAHLYDLNPVGLGAMLLAIILAGCAHFNLLGPIAQAFAPFIALMVAFVAAPILALATHGRFYIARRTHWLARVTEETCVMCENTFEVTDMAHCPMYAAPICSLCCTLETSCHDRCKTDSRATQQLSRWIEYLLPRRLARFAHSSVGHFILVMVALTIAIGAVIGALAWQINGLGPEMAAQAQSVLLSQFLLLFVLGGILSWIMVLVHHSRRSAMRENEHQLRLLQDEVAAHNVTEAALQKAKEAAESANFAKSRYLVNVSHEIRSPLNSIYGYSQLLERGSDVSPAEAAKVVRRSSEHLINLVEGLLDISQVESGVLRITNDTVRFPPFVDQIANMFRPQAQSKGIAYLFERTPHLPDFVRTDQKRLRQILINLLSNAIKFTKAGSVTFRVTYRSQLATFEIIDTGIGIAAEDLERVFEPFERGGDPDAQREKGVGLGLAITQALVRILGGDLAVASEPGKGTHFTLRLMLSQVVSTDPDPKPLDSIAAYEGKRRKILVIDDDPLQIGIVRKLLEALDFNVFGAHSGAEGRALAQQEEPDLVLLDISMPGESGWDICDQLREAHGNALKIVMVSANAHEFSRGGDGQAKHDMFLKKPVELDAMLDMVAEQLSIRWISEPSDVLPRPLAPTEAPRLGPEAEPFLAEIESKALIGHVRGIEAGIRALEAAFPTFDDLIAQLLDQLDRFALQDLLRTIRSQR